MWWKTDLLKLAVGLLPPMLRGGLTVSLLRVLMLPVRYIYNKLQARRKTADQRLGTTANVVSMEKALNDAFFLTDGQIMIESGDADDRVFWHMKADGQEPATLWMKTEKGTVLKKRGEASYKDSFTVWVPTFLCTSTDSTEDRYGGRNLRDIKILLNYYKPAGRTYRIELYDYE